MVYSLIVYYEIIIRKFCLIIRQIYVFHLLVLVVHIHKCKTSIYYCIYLDFVYFVIVSYTTDCTY